MRNASMWSETVEFEQPRRRYEFRLAIEEYQFVSADYIDFEGDAKRYASRLAYVKIFALDESSTNDNMRGRN